MTYKKTNFVKHINIYRNIYRKNLSAIVYRLPISLQEIEIYRSLLLPVAFLKLSIIVIASVQKGLSCPTLVSSKLPESHRNYSYCYCIKNKSKQIRLRTTATAVSTAHCSLARYRCSAEKHSSQKIFRLEEISWYLVCMSLSLVGWTEKAARSASVFFLRRFEKPKWSPTTVARSCKICFCNSVQSHVLRYKFKWRSFKIA